MGGPVSTILLVEDDPDIRELVAYKLSRGGFEVIEAADGLAALQAARTRPPDAVVLDMGLPGCPASRCAGSCAPRRPPPRCRSSC
jgi:DNA-binding response OmpR family regulator